MEMYDIAAGFFVSSKKSQQILMYLKHMPTPTLILKNCAAIVQ